MNLHAPCGARLAVPALILMAAVPVEAAELPACLEASGTIVVAAEAIDGDTVALADGRIVRLAGVEAPKRPLAVPDDRPWPAADAARAGLHDLVAGAPVTLLQSGSATDRHGRIPGRLLLADGRWVEGELAASGLVRARWLAGETSCFQALLAIERGAREAARGLWASPAYAVLGADDPSLRSRNGLYELVEGRIVSVGHGSRMVFLDFGRNVRSDFTAMVPPAVAEQLAVAGISVDGLAGRRVRVRGVIEESGGPAIRLNDIAELEVID
jgi:endonuclease YncB( thermonuclease family)